MITLAPSIAAVILGALAFAAFVLRHREEQARRRAIEEQATAEAKAKAIRAEVADALETLNARGQGRRGAAGGRDQARAHRSRRRAPMTPAEVREVVADLTDETPTVMPDGRMRGEHAWKPTGKDRIGATGAGCVAHHPCVVVGCPHCRVRGEVRWYETTNEMFERAA